MEASEFGGGTALILVLLIALILPISILFCSVSRMPPPPGVLIETTSAADGSTDLLKTARQPPRMDDGKQTSEKLTPMIDSTGSLIPQRASICATDESSPDKTTGITTNTWRCACEGGFLPAGMFGNAEAVFKMGTGQCYHKQL